MRPVFSRSGRAAVVAVRSAGFSGAMKRALLSLPKIHLGEEAPAALYPAGSPLHRRHSVNAPSDKAFNPLISKSRSPLFSNAERAACSRKILGGRREAKRRAKPSRLRPRQ
jgi:hypothetical protein